MEGALFLVTLVLGLFSAGVFVGYKFRDFVGKEVSKFAADLKTAYKDAQSELEAGHSLLQKTYEAAKADAEKAVSDLASVKDKALATIESIKKI
jgi:hypothetical protein